MTYYDFVLIAYGFAFGSIITSIFALSFDIYFKKKYESRKG